MPLNIFGNRNLREGDGMNQLDQRWDRATLIQLSILILIVPAQLLLTDWLGTQEFERSDMIRR